MNFLLVLNESFTNGYKVESLDITSLIAIFCGILVIISKNPVVSVLYLIGLFLSISCYLMILGINYIGLSYLLVYVGAVSILFLFILMLINVRISELLSNTSNSIPLAIITVISFSYSVYEILPYNIATFGTNFITNTINLLIVTFFNFVVFKHFKSFNYNNENELVFVTSKAWDSNLAEISHISSIGNIMYTNYSMWLIITSIILLLAMVGAIVITIKQK